MLRANKKTKQNVYKKSKKKKKSNESLKLYHHQSYFCIKVMITTTCGWRAALLVKWQQPENDEV
jgi:hypothetical protein